MRHRIQDKKFNRHANARKALFMGLLRNLTERGEIVTTKAKAKVLKKLADKMVGTAQTNSVATRRELHKTFGKRDVVNTLVERVAPAMSDRKFGYTRITDMGNRRGDNTPMAKIAFVTQAKETGLKSGKTYAEKVVKGEVVKTAAAKKPAAKKEAKAEKPVAKRATKTVKAEK